MPEECPVCGESVVKEGPNHYCPNVSCPAQVKRSIEHFCSEDAMDIEGVGEEVADRLVEEGLVESVSDLYDLEESDLTALDQWGDRSARNLLRAIKDSKDVDLANFIHALGIRHVGIERARQLATAFDLEALRSADRDALQSVEDIGPEVAASIASFFDTQRNQREIDRLLEAGVEPSRSERTEELAGTTLAITGSIAGYTREELVGLLERHGADVTGSVSSETDLLVVGDNPGQRKREDAEANDVEQIDQSEFQDRILARLPSSES